jgi:hypothetical protein
LSLQLLSSKIIFKSVPQRVSHNRSTPYRQCSFKISESFHLSLLTISERSYFGLSNVMFRSRLAQSVQCLATGWTTGRSRFDPRQRRKDFSSNLCVQTGSGADPASCTMGTGGSFPGDIARQDRDADHSPPSNVGIRNE